MMKVRVWASGPEHWRMLHSLSHDARVADPAGIHRADVRPQRHHRKGILEHAQRRIRATNAEYTFDFSLAGARSGATCPIVSTRCSNH
jgi:hypothetical protein